MVSLHIEIEKLLGDLPSKVSDLTNEENEVKSSLELKEEDRNAAWNHYTDIILTFAYKLN